MSLTVFGSGNTRSIRPHIHSLQQLNVNALTLSLFLFSRCTKTWNLLPNQVVTATSRKKL